MKFLVVPYFVFLVPSLVGTSILWQGVAFGRFFYCDDSLGFDFIPPFAHIGVSSGDAYYIPEAQVYLIWSGFVVVALLLPLLALKIFGFFNHPAPENA